MMFPNEPKPYRVARKRLLRAEIALRRKLPAGGKVPQDYVFEEGDPPRAVKLSELFGERDTVVAYSFMYGPQMAKACPMCTSMLDGLDGNAQHIAQRANLVVIAKSPIARILDYARGRSWSNLRLLSSAGNSYNADYLGEAADASQLPMLNVFARRKGAMRHFYGTELLFAKADPGGKRGE